MDGTLVHAWSYSGDRPPAPTGGSMSTNELSGVEITRTVVLIPGVLTTTLTLTTTDSVFVVDPGSGTRELIASGLTAPEGLTFLPAGGFAALRGRGGPGRGRGRLSVV